MADRDDDDGDGGVSLDDRRSENADADADADAGEGGRPKAGKCRLRAGVALAPAGLAQTRQVVAALVVRTTKRQERLGDGRGSPGLPSLLEVSSPLSGWMGLKGQAKQQTADV